MKLRILFIALSIVGLFFGVRVAGTATNSFQTATLTTRGPIQNVRFTVYDAGIYPHQLRAKPGVVAIVLQDHTRRGPGLVIERETAGGNVRLAEISFPLHQSRTRTELGLGLGRYRVSDATNPANQAEIVVEP